MQFTMKKSSDLTGLDPGSPNSRSVALASYATKPSSPMVYFAGGLYELDVLRIPVYIVAQESWVVHITKPLSRG
jgi:hypothetical protein